LFKIDSEDETEPAWVAEFKEAVGVIKKIAQTEHDEKESLLVKMKTIGESAGIAWREGSPLNAPKSLPTDPAEYGDPANWEYPVSEKLAGDAVDHFNDGHGLEKYSPRERHILGRRITQLAGRFGGKYVYDPILCKITQQEEVTTMNDETITKLDVGAVVAQLKAARDTAADLIGKDPAALKDALSMLMGHIDALDVSSPATAGSSAPVKDESTPIGKVASTSDKPTTTEPTTTVASAPAGAKTEAKVDGPKAKKPAETTTESTTTDDDETTEAYKALSAKVDQMSADVSKMIEAVTKAAQRPQGVDPNSPINGLNAIVAKSVNPVLDNPIIKALDEGGPYALLKALKAAGADDEIGGALAWQTMNNAIRAATYAHLEEGGVITASRYAGKLLG
jgi:hypothetical protein